MTVRELEDKIFETQMYISDKFRDIQMQAQSLKSVEDEAKVQITLTKIIDFVEEVRRGYDTLNALHHEEPEEPDPEENGMSFFE